VEQLDVAVSGFDRYTPAGRWTLDLATDAGHYLALIADRLRGVDRRATEYDLVLYNAGMDPYERCVVGGLDGIDDTILRERERMVFQWLRGHGWPVAFVLAGGYARDPDGRRDLVALHRATIEAAVRPA
jgi:acetoin utilization deacetylase AcuC-like enzyme